MDDTSTRKYESFRNLCTGFSAQMYARYSSRSRLSAEAIARLREADVDATQPLPKFRLPLLMATYPGHLFNALLIDETDLHAIDSYIFFEPQNDRVFHPESEEYGRYILRRGVTLLDLVDFNEKRQYIMPEVASFLPSGRKGMIRVTNRRIRDLYHWLTIAESGRMNYEHYVGDLRFDHFIQMRARPTTLTEQELLEAASIVEGLPFREHPDDIQTPLTRERFFELLGRSPRR